MIRKLIRLAFGIPEPSVEDKFFEEYARRLAAQSKHSPYTFSGRPAKYISRV